MPAEVLCVGRGGAARTLAAELLPEGALRVGVAWQGNPDYPRDHERSVPLRKRAAGTVQGVRLFSLQKGRGVEQLAEVADLLPITDLAASLDNDGAFVDTAAVLQHLDLLVTSDSALPPISRGPWGAGLDGGAVRP